MEECDLRVKAIEINTSGRPGRYKFASILRCKLKATKAYE